MYLKFGLLALLLVQAVHSVPVYKRSTKGSASKANSYQSPVANFKTQQVKLPVYPAKGGAVQAPVQQNVGPVIAAVITKRTQEVIDIPVVNDVVTPQIVIVEPHMQPVTIEFRSRSSPVNINQVHIPGEKGIIKTTRSEEEPDRVIHEVVKPIIQEVREIIQPFRKITQQILPVQEEVNSVVSRGESKQIEQAQDDIVQQQQQEEAVSEPQIVQIPQKAEQVKIEQAVLAPAQPAANTGTIVQAGLIGGTRILAADDAVFQQQEEDLSQVLSSINNRPNGLKNKRNVL